MKLKKQIKNRVVAVAMLAIVMFCAFSLPHPDVAQASTFSITRYTEIADGVADVDSKGDQFIYKVTMNVDSSDKVYCFIDRGIYSNSCGSSAVIVMFVRDVTNGCEGFSSPQYMNWECSLLGRNGKFGTNNIYQFASDSKKYSVAVFHFSSNKGDFKSAVSRSFTMDYSSILEKCNSSALTSYQALLDCSQDVQSPYTSYVSECSGDTSEALSGSSDNPIKKDDFGYPQIYNSTYIHNDPNNLETLDKLYSGQDFQWKKKTTTGFDLTNNDYNYTYIECKVKANYQYNDKFSGKGSWHDFSSYGEMGNLGKVRAESLSHYYTFQEFQEALPKTSNELSDHKMRAIKSSAVYYFRVVCMKTSSTVVIPDEKDCKYYAGPWRSVTVTKINGKDGTSVVEDGEFDENGEWKKDDDSGDNGKDIDNGSAEGDDLSDASDKAHETINSNANKSTLDLDSAKAFINQVADVPKMIADIFSFLPDWVKYSFAFGFALIPILIIFKLIRG